LDMAALEHRRSRGGGTKGAMTPQNFQKIWSFCALRGVFLKKLVPFA